MGRGVVGEVVVKGEGVCGGYMGGVKRGGVKGGGVYFTGDLGRVGWWGEKEGEEGGWILEYVGRKDKQAKVGGGFRVECSEVESIMMEVGGRGEKGWSQCVVVPVEVEGVVRLVAYVVSGSCSSSSFFRPLPPPLLKQLKLRLPPYSIPSLFTSLPSLPLTTSGKLNKTALPFPTKWKEESGERKGKREEGEEKEKFSDFYLRVRKEMAVVIGIRLFFFLFFYYDCFCYDHCLTPPSHHNNQPTRNNKKNTFF